MRHLNKICETYGGKIKEKWDIDLRFSTGAIVPIPHLFSAGPTKKTRTVVSGVCAPERVADEAFLILDMVIPLGSSGISLTCPFVAACK